MKKLGVNVDVLVVRDGKVLLGLLAERWNYQGKRSYGVPGGDILYGEAIGETVTRNLREEFGARLTKHEIISVNANRALGSHFIGIGVLAEMDGETLRESDDWDKWERFPLDGLPDNLFPAAQNVLDSYRRHKVNVAE